MLFECRRNKERQHQGYFSIDLRVFAIQGDFSPGDGFGRLGSAIRRLELVSCVDVDLV